MRTCLGLENARLGVYGRVVIVILLFFLLFDPGKPAVATAPELALPLPLEVVRDRPVFFQFKAIVNSL